MSETKALLRIIELMISGYDYKFDKDHIVFYSKEVVELEPLLEQGKTSEREIIFEITIKNLRGKIAELKKRIRI